MPGRVSSWWTTQHQGPELTDYLVQHQGPLHLEAKLASHLSNLSIHCTKLFSSWNHKLLRKDYASTIRVLQRCYSFKLIILLWDNWCCDPHFIGMEIEVVNNHTFWRLEREESLQETAVKLTSSSTQSMPIPFKWCSKKKEDGFHSDNPPARATEPHLDFVPTQNAKLDCSALSTYVPMLKSIFCQLGLACYCY